MNEEIVHISTGETNSKEKQHSLKPKFITKHRHFTLNEKAAIQIKIKSGKDQSFLVKMVKGNNLRIYSSTTVFEKIRRKVVRPIQGNTNPEHVKNEDQKGQVNSETITRCPRDKNSRGQRVIFTINIYRTKSSFFINEPQVQKFIQEILPAIQSWAQVNKLQQTCETSNYKRCLENLIWNKTRYFWKKKKLS